ncbi:ABC transporter permease [Rhizobium sp. LjRoot30]|uniref:ABC transporter permease n=1 Tax=Rhizobium sp. LjRoot30 TaxID=3342320 RepID=UPI003ECFF963
MAETGTAKASTSGGFKRWIERYPFLPALGILIILLALNGIFSPNSLSYRSLTGLISTYLALIMLAIAQTYVIFAGDIDLSAGAVVSLVNVVIIVLMEKMGGGGLAVFAALGIGVLTGLVCGLINGIVVAGLRLQAIVATFATSIFFTGFALWVMPVAGTPAPALFWRTYGSKLLGLPFVFYVLAALAILLFVISRTRLALQLLSVGDDAQAAYQTGLPVTPIRIKGYLLCGLFSALAAFCVTGDTASGDPLVGGKMTLFSVAAVVLGGSALAGGWGTVVGSLLGALTIGLINSLVFFIGTPSEWQNFVQGLAILVVLMAGILVGRRARA